MINNKWTKLAAAAIMAGGLLVPGAASAAAVSFTDIEGSYAKDAILALADADGVVFFGPEAGFKTTDIGLDHSGC